MRSISKEILIDLLELILEKATLVINRNQSITCAQDFLTSPDRMEKFDAACMLIQVVGETAKKIDDRTSSLLFAHYPQVYWRGVFGCRNIISHEYANIDYDIIWNVINKHLTPLKEVVEQLIEDL